MPLVRLRAPAGARVPAAHRRAHTLIRGHEQVPKGFKTLWEDGEMGFYTIFSAGGAEKPDLPSKSPYRKIRPMALSTRTRAEAPEHYAVETWPIAWQAFADPARNGFLAR